MGWINDNGCPEHANLAYSNHENPTECENALLASIGFASCLNDVTIWEKIDPSIEVVTRFKKNETLGKISCYDAEGYGCQLEPYLFRQVRIGMGPDMVDQVMEVLVGEQCPHCEVKMFVRKLPDYMEAWTGDKSYVS
jgi:hypothetical protein